MPCQHTRSAPEAARSTTATATGLPARGRTGGKARLRWPAGLALLALWLVGWVLPAAAQVQPPARVGRLVEAPPGVWLQDRDSSRWIGARDQSLVNWPLTSGDRLRTDPGARAELRIGSVTLRIDGDADLSLQRLDDQRIVFWLQQGSAALRVADGARAAEVELQTREGRFLPQRAGHYRFDRQPDATQASVWRGELRFEERDSRLTIAEGRRADLWQQGPDAATHYAWATIDRDAFADWVARDERRDEAPLAARYVSPEMTGWQDLDRHGDWTEAPEVGVVWLPRYVPPGWAPYRDGRWAWVAPWGWTWIDAAPWGFAPFHYGVWLQWQGRWGWSPGPRQHRPVYAPVLGGWVGPPRGPVDRGPGGRPPPPVVVVPAPPPHGHGHDRPWLHQPPPWVVRPVVPPHADRPSAPQAPRDAGRDGRRDDARDARRDPPREAPREAPRDDRRPAPRGAVPDGGRDGLPGGHPSGPPRGPRDDARDHARDLAPGPADRGSGRAAERGRADDKPDKSLPQNPWGPARPMATPSPAPSPEAAATPAAPAPAAVPRAPAPTAAPTPVAMPAAAIVTPVQPPAAMPPVADRPGAGRVPPPALVDRPAGGRPAPVVQTETPSPPAPPRTARPDRPERPERPERKEPAERGEQADAPRGRDVRNWR